MLPSQVLSYQKNRSGTGDSDLFAIYPIMMKWSGAPGDKRGIQCINRVLTAGWSGYGSGPAAGSLMPYKHTEPHHHKIPKARYKVSNWREYGQALQQRGSLTVWVTPEALEA
jgi:hypothetical protein